eukprot:TRINITY_DN385_c0_g1_i14.p1 TRINITY_DN385_c0_g1~~TRINITY_DN385_c0_g1_i14.p1  ORF type:complete len:898 (-),score=346.07 TRINITY_DN385_c0_g1_i14:3259-5952(-)
MDDLWALCLETLRNTGDEQVKFWCLQQLSDTMLPEGQYFDLASDEQEAIIADTFDFLKTMSQRPLEEYHVKNKIALLLTRLAKAELFGGWTNFFNDFLSLLEDDKIYLEMWLRLQLTLHEEVVMDDASRTDDEKELNTNIKDLIREQHANDFVEVWVATLEGYGDNVEDVDLCKLCLEVMTHYIRWMDIVLFANDQVINLLNDALDTDYGEEALVCYQSFVNKGMPAAEKLELLELLNLAELVESKYRPEDLEYHVAMAKLVNSVGYKLVQCWSEVEDDLEDQVGFFLHDWIQVAFKFLNDDDDEVSGAVYEFGKTYLNRINRMEKPLPDPYPSHLLQFFEYCLRKVRYEEDYDFENPQDDEAAIDTYRGEMFQLMRTVARSIPDLVQSSLMNHIVEVIDNMSDVPFYDLEAPLSALFELGQSYKSKHGVEFDESFIEEAVVTIVEKDVVSFPHESIQKVFFEIVVRFSNDVELTRDHYLEIVMAFTDERGIGHKLGYVRKRAAYLFVKYVAFLKEYLRDDMAGDVVSIVETLQPFLEDEGRMIAAHQKQDGHFELFEAAGSLTNWHLSDEETVSQLLELSVGPLLQTMTEIMEDEQAYQNEEGEELFALSNMFQCLAFFAAPFPACNGDHPCREYFEQGMDMATQCLKGIQNKPDWIVAGILVFLRRMVTVLGEDFLDYFSEQLELLVECCQVKEMVDVLALIPRLMGQFPEQMVEIVSPVLSYLCQTSHELMDLVNARKQSGSFWAQVESEREQLQKQYMMFLICLIDMKAPINDILLNQNDETIALILQTIADNIEFAVDNGTIRGYIKLLKRMLPVVEPSDEAADVLFNQLLATFLTYSGRSSVKLKDMQSNMILEDIASCQSAIYEQYGDAFTTFLQEEARGRGRDGETRNK